MGKISPDTYPATTELLLWLHSSHPDNPWEHRECVPNDIRDISWLFQKVLENAQRALSTQKAYKCFQIPKGNGKFRSIEAPDGDEAIWQLDDETWDSEVAKSYIGNIWEERRRQIDRIIDGEFYEDDGFNAIRTILTPAANDTTISLNVVRSAQQAINQILSPRLRLGDWVCGFRYGSWAYNGLRNILEPLYHRKTPRIASVYQIDIRNFFPSVTEEMAYNGLFQALSDIIPSETAATPIFKQIVQLLVHTGCYKWRLPQGGHLSPVLANCAAQNLIDFEIIALLKSHQNQKGTPESTLSYGRYADDIVVLSGAPIPEKLRDEIDAIVRKHFEIADDKRLYEEGKKRYNIWWASLLADRQFERIVFTPHKKMKGDTSWATFRESIGYSDFWFKLPKNIERRVSAVTLDCINQMKTPEGMRQIMDGNSELAHTFRQVVGYFSHAYNISRPGGVIHKGSDGKYYWLPKQLLFVWEKLVEISRQVVNPTIFQKTFIIETEDSFEAEKAKADTRKRELFQQENQPALAPEEKPVFSWYQERDMRWELWESHRAWIQEYIQHEDPGILL